MILKIRVGKYILLYCACICVVRTCCTHLERYTDLRVMSDRKLAGKS